MKSEIENKMVRNGDGACVREGETEGKAGRERREEVLETGKKRLLLCIFKKRQVQSKGNIELELCS